MIRATLCYVITEGKILLIKKKKGIGEGRFNGPGGKIDENENPQMAAVRETVEETGVMPLNPEHVGVIAFYNGQKEKPDWLVHVFTATKFKGEPINTDEADPQWFDVKEIPYDSMWPDDKIWMPLMLNKKRFMGKFYFDEDGKKLENHEIISLDNV